MSAPRESSAESENVPSRFAAESVNSGAEEPTCNVSLGGCICGFCPVLLRFHELPRADTRGIEQPCARST